MENRPSLSRTLAAATVTVGLGLIGNLITNAISPPAAWRRWWVPALWAILAVLFVAAVVLDRVRGKSSFDLERQRRLFVGALIAEVTRISAKDNWRDDRFAELHAELEVTSGRRGPRRVRSLTRALRRSRDRLILLQGEPGAGKSVALRHLALREQRGVIPLYLNLKELRRDGSEPVDATTIREFVLAALNRSRSAGVAEFLATELDAGMRNGTWVFLFDSFDEIPDILTATEVEPVVEEYADAVHAFLHTMNVCRGVVASREFRGPRRFGWPRFTILRLTDRQKRRLIRRAGLTPAQEGLLVGGITSAGSVLGPFSDNPMLLGLLTDFVARNDALPRTSHEVFEDFVAGRLARDRDRVEQRFGLDAAALRSAAEMAAFCMAASPGLGLSPSYDELVAAVEGRFGPQPDLRERLEALAFVKLASSATTPGGGSEFSFVHRRFQEFFATARVLSANAQGVAASAWAPEATARVLEEAAAVPLEQLLTAGQWRETAVTLLQTRADDDLLRTTERLVRDAIPTRSRARRFAWPPGALHLLSLLSAGLDEDSVARLDPRVRGRIGRLLRRAYESGSRADQVWAIENVSAAPEPDRDELLDQAAGSPSLLLQESALAQVGRLRVMPPSLARQVRGVLIGRAGRGRLWRDRHAILAGIRRLRDPRPFTRLIGVLLATPVLDAAVVATFALVALVRGTPTWRLPVIVAAAEAVALIGYLVPCLAVSMSAAESAAGRWRSWRDPLDSVAVIATILRAYGLAVLVAAISGWHLLPALVTCYSALCFHTYLSTAASPEPLPLNKFVTAPVIWTAREIRELLDWRDGFTWIHSEPKRAAVRLIPLVVALAVSTTYSVVSAEPVERSSLRLIIIFLLAVAVVGTAQECTTRTRARRDRRRITEAGALDSAGIRALLTGLHTDRGLFFLVRGLRRNEFTATPDAVQELRTLDTYRVRPSQETLDEIARLIAERLVAAE
ncbi:NACHT domain-containing protein [Actinoplanes sp. NPDC020271]|uniref:NACHT domain-containing protein n=1 Tax=Actinoplanes sp. NPDC020271 TaxID=3363896 RepID=UPI00378A0B76